MTILQFFQEHTWALLIATFLPILAWILYFQYLNRERFGSILIAFIAGMLSVLTMLLYEKYWDMGILWFQHLNIFSHLAELIHQPSAALFLSFLVMSILLSIGIFIFVTIMMFALEVGSGDNTVALFMRKLRCVSDSPSLFVFAGLGLGLLAWAAFLTLPHYAWKALMVGALEEYVKHLCLRFADEEKIINFDDAISFSIMVALGFAFVENFLYFQQHLSDPYIFQGVFILRSTLSVLAHVGFSAIFGYFYGLAHFSHEIYQTEVSEGKHKLLKLFHKVCHLKGETVFREEMMLEGMIIAMVLHALFNSLLEGHSIQAALPVVFGMFFIVLNLYHRKRLHHRRGHILQL